MTMALRARILRLLTPEYGGERTRSVLAGIAGGDKKLRPVLDELIEAGLVKVRRCYGGQRYGLTRQRGNMDLYVALGIVIALGVLGAGAAWWVHGQTDAAYKAGKAFVQKDWDDAKLAAVAERKARDAAVAGALDTLAKKLADADKRADEHFANWQEARRANRGKPLGSCEEQGQDSAQGAPVRDVAGGIAGPGLRSPGGPAGDRSAIRLHWRFVGLWDGAFSSGADGQPLFGAAQAYALAPERADSASPYSLDDVLDVHGENARRFDKCRRDLNAAIDAVEAAERSWSSVKH